MTNDSWGRFQRERVVLNGLNHRGTENCLDEGVVLLCGCHRDSERGREPANVHCYRKRKVAVLLEDFRHDGTLGCD